jgi:hypothetical protein
MSMVTTKSMLETVIQFVDGEPRVKSNQPVTPEYLRLLLTVIQPFAEYPGNRYKIDNGHAIRIRAVFLEDDLDSYTVGFTSNTNITIKITTSTN